MTKKEHKGFVFFLTMDESINALAKEYDEGWKLEETVHTDGYHSEMILSREVPTVSEKETVDPPTAYYTEAQMRESFEKGVDYEGTRYLRSNITQAEFLDEYIANIPKSRDYVTVPSVGERPSNDLLWEAYEKGIELGGFYRDHRNQLFSKWVAGLPADPLEADRKWLLNIIQGADIGGFLNRHGYGTMFTDAIKRLCGYGN